MKKLYEVDAVIIFMTPGYKAKVINRTQGGVYTEHKYIYERYTEVEEKKKASLYYDDFALIPILFSGTHDTSVIDELKHLKYTSAVNFKAIDRHGKLRVPDSIIKTYKNEIESIIADIITVNNKRSPQYTNDYNQLFKLLFMELKADWHGHSATDGGIDFNIMKKMFVKTYAYKKVIQQNGYFLVGRKGSGKSTVATFMAYQNGNRYKGVVPIIVNKFNLETMFCFLSLDRIKSDTKHIFKQQDVFSFAWALFFHICSMDLIISEHNHGKLNTYQSSCVEPIIEYFAKELPYNDTDNKISAYYEYSLQSMVDFIDSCINSARNNDKSFIPDLAATFNINRFLDFSLGKNIVKAFYDIIDVCRRRILITLDGFDTAFDEFRLTSIKEYSGVKMQDRSLLEIEWLRSLLHLSLEIKQDHNASNKFYQLIDLCFTIPKDRFIEIEDTDRDSYIYHNRCTELNWTGIELAILVRKRLEVINNIRTDKLSHDKRLASVLQSSYSNIPTDIKTTVGKREYIVTLFIYILKHTFWRPRDVLFYFARIIALSKNMKEMKQHMSSDTIKRIVKDTTYDIINSEFINEFKSTLINIKDIVLLFQGKKQILTFKEIEEVLSTIKFHLSHQKEGVNDIKSKIALLYEIGFLGFDVISELRERYSINAEEAFYFNEGNVPLKALNTLLIDKCNFVIHPIFCEYLQLDTSQNRLTLNYSWDYLRERDLLQFLL